MKHAAAGVGAALVLGTAIQAPSLMQKEAVAASGCQLAQIAFCDTFDAPAPNSAGSRSGDLDPVVWGVSRTTSNDNPSQGNYYEWNASHLNKCGTTVLVGTPRDVEICNGTLVDSMFDAGAVTMLAMYPKQPFDFAGRVGHVVMDIANDTQGSHMAWPEIIVTDQPVPAPTEDSAGVADFARNSFGVALGADCLNGALVPNGQGNAFAISSVWTSANYAFSTQSFHMTGCVLKSAGVGHPMNHVELRISPSHFEVWATDAGSATLKELGYGDFTMPLTRGLVWMEDVHYNACKDPGTQCDHTFQWDNFGFDGPILPRDLTFDIADAQQGGSGSLGYLIPQGGKTTLPINNVGNVANASAALFTFTWWTREQDSITYSFNGHAAHTQPWPYGAEDLYKSKTLAVSVPLSELVNGTNSVTLSSTASSFGGVSIANMDIILVGAGGLPGGASPAVATSTPTPTATTAPPPTPAPQIVTPTPTPTTTTAAPPPSTVFLGNPTVAGSQDSNSLGQAEAFPYAASATGSATKLHVYLDGTNTANRVIVGVYTNSSANQPGALLAQATITAPVSGWNTVSIPGINLTAGTPYWIAVLAPAGSSGKLAFRDIDQNGVSVTSSQASLTALPAAWSTGATWPTANMSATASN